MTLQQIESRELRYSRTIFFLIQTKVFKSTDDGLFLTNIS